MTVSIISKSLLLILIIGVLRHASSVVWRYTPAELPEHHHLAKDDVVRHYWVAEEDFIFSRLDGVNTGWLEPAKCETKALKSQTVLTCKETGKYYVGVQENCTGKCDNELNQVTVRVNESPSCFFWYASVEEIGLNKLKLQVKTAPIRNWNDAVQSKAVNIFTVLFHDSGEFPILKRFANTRCKTECFVYNSSLELWEMEVTKKELFHSAFVHITSAQTTALFGCSVATTAFCLNLVNNSLSLFKDPTAVALKATKDIVGQVYSHPCYPERNVLATEDKLFYSEDEFSSVVYLEFNSSLAKTYNDEVEGVAFSFTDVIILLKGSLFGANVQGKSIDFELLIVGQNATLLGVENSGTCLSNTLLHDFFAWEANYIVAWSSDTVFLVVGSGIHNETLWSEMALPKTYSGATISSVKLSTHPGYLALSIIEGGKPKLLVCSFAENSLNCSEQEISDLFAKNSFQMEFLSTALPSLILWDSRYAGYSYDGGERSGIFKAVDSVKNVIFDHEHTLWLIQTTKNLLYYGSGKCLTVTVLRRVDKDGDNLLTYHFRQVDNRVLRLTWKKAPVAKDGLISEVYPLYDELYSVVHSGSNVEFQQLCDYTTYISSMYDNGGNSKNLESFDEEIMVNFTLVYPSSIEVMVKFKTNFLGLAKLSDRRNFISTHSSPGKPELRIQSVQAMINGTCTKARKPCDTGIILLETEVETKSQSATCLLPMSQVLFVNVTCPIGLHVRVRNETTEPCHPLYSDRECGFVIKQRFSFYPIIEMYRFDTLVETITSDVKLTEIHGRAGFSLLSKNLLLKTCYFCALFIETNVSSEIFLQTFESACPCQQEDHDRERWVANISFGDSYAPPDSSSNTFIFRVEVIGSSYCDLQTEFSLTVTPLPQLPSSLWEYLVLVVFIVGSLCILAMSYRRYMQYVKVTLHKFE